MTHRVERLLQIIDAGNALIRNGCCDFPPDRIHAEYNARFPDDTLVIATVYRFLKRMRDTGIVQTVDKTVQIYKEITVNLAIDPDKGLPSNIIVGVNNDPISPSTIPRDAIFFEKSGEMTLKRFDITQKGRVLLSMLRGRNDT